MKQNLIRKGRLAEFDEQALRFTSSIAADAWFFRYDILIDLAHVAMLKKQSLIAQTTFEVLTKELLKINEQGYVKLPQDVDDVHVAIETA